MEDNDKEEEDGKAAVTSYLASLPSDPLSRARSIIVPFATQSPVLINRNDQREQFVPCSTGAV